ncbi:hypothetical protein D3C80_1062370 [compost metagenome]
MPAVIEFPPRIRTLEDAPGRPELCVTTTPATAPLNKLSAEEVTCDKLAFGTEATDPVISFLF